MFGKMKIYTVHVKPGQANAYEKPVFVREGFNLLAFIFTFFWALYHRLWAAIFLLVGAYVAVLALEKMHIVSAQSVVVIYLVIKIIWAFHANDWLRARLARRGYIMADISAADSLLRAEQRYFERTIASAH